MTAHQFDAAVLDSGDVMWQPWMVGRDWTPADAHLPWVPWSLSGGIGTPAIRLPANRVAGSRLAADSVAAGPRPRHPVTGHPATPIPDPRTAAPAHGFAEVPTG